MAKQIQFKGSASSPGFRPEQVGNQEIANMQRESNRVANIMRASAESEINELKRQAGAISNNQEAAGAARRDNNQITTNNASKAVQQLQFDAESARQQLETNQAATRKTFQAISMFSQSALDQMQKLDEERFKRDRLGLYEKFLSNPDIGKLIDQIRGEGELKITDVERDRLIDAAVASGQIDELTGQQLKSMSSGARLGLEQARGVHQLTTVYQQKLLAAEAEMGAMTPPQKAAHLVKFRQEFLTNPENGIDGRALIHLKPELLRTGLDSTNQLHQSILADARKTHTKALREQVIIDANSILTQNPQQFNANIYVQFNKIKAAHGPEAAHKWYRELINVRDARGNQIFSLDQLRDGVVTDDKWPDGTSKTYGEIWKNGIGEMAAAQKQADYNIQTLQNRAADLQFAEATKEAMAIMRADPSQANVNRTVAAFQDVYKDRALPQEMKDLQKSGTTEAKTKADLIAKLVATPEGMISQAKIDQLYVLDPEEAKKLERRYEIQERPFKSDVWKTAVKSIKGRAHGLNAVTGQPKDGSPGTKTFEYAAIAALRANAESLQAATPSLKMEEAIKLAWEQLEDNFDEQENVEGKTWYRAIDQRGRITYPELESKTNPTVEAARRQNEALRQDLQGMTPAALAEWTKTRGNIMSDELAEQVRSGWGTRTFRIPGRIQLLARVLKMGPYALMNQAMRNRGLDALPLPDAFTNLKTTPEQERTIADARAGWEASRDSLEKARADTTGDYSRYTNPLNMRSSFREDAPIPAGNQSAAWSALGATIAWAEGGQYNNMFGNATFNDFSRHPDRVQSAGGHRSAAAGRYQFMPGTYSGLQQAYPELTDFSPENQERAGELLAKRRGVDTTQFIETKEEFIQIMHLMSPEWAALPNQDNKGGSYYTDQRARKIDDLWQYYQARVKQFRGY